MRLTLQDVMAALSHTSPAEPAGPIVFEGIGTDSRSVKPGELFVALRSESADGHQFVGQAVKKGAAGFVVSEQVAVPRGVPVVRVPDTEVAYGLLARFWREQFEIPVIGITGSVGKTTTKEMTAAALTPLGPILKTEKSQNGETGVPKTLLGLNPEHRAAVIEMGMRGMGQIGYLAGIARPTIGAITIVSDNHAELLGSRSHIADAKGELMAALPHSGVAVLNADDPFFERLRGRTHARVVTYGVKSAANYRALDVAPRERGWSFQVCGVPVTIDSPSRHDVGNALAALAIAEAAGVALEDAIEALAGYTPPPMRMEVRTAPWGGTILNDAYNAAPASVASALETLRDMPGTRKIAFLGDMRELGELGPAAHRALGDAIGGIGVLSALYTVGDLAALIPGAAERFSSSAAAAAWAKTSFDARPGDVILVKGSRAVAMEAIVDTLVEERQATVVSHDV